MRVFVCARVRARVRACARARVCVCVCARAHALLQDMQAGLKQFTKPHAATIAVNSRRRRTSTDLDLSAVHGFLVKLLVQLEGEQLGLEGGGDVEGPLLSLPLPFLVTRDAVAHFPRHQPDTCSCETMSSDTCLCENLS